MTPMSNARDSKPGQTICFKKWATDRQRITVEVEQVETVGHTTFITGRRITRSARNAAWTTTHRRRCFATNPDTPVEVIA